MVGMIVRMKIILIVIVNNNDWENGDVDDAIDCVDYIFDVYDGSLWFWWFTMEMLGWRRAARRRDRPKTDFF